MKRVPSAPGMPPATTDAGNPVQYEIQRPSGDSGGSMFRPDVEVNLTRRPFEAASEVEGRSCDPWKANRIVITAMSTVADTSGQLYRRPGIGVAELSSTSAMKRYPR